MKKMLLLAVSAMLLAVGASAQNPKRTVLYKLAPGETINYGEYMVDFSSPNKNYVATVVDKENSWMVSEECGYKIYNCGDYYRLPYKIILNGQEKHFDWGKSNEIYRPEKSVGTNSWNEISQTWKDSEGYYIKYNGHIYGPYDIEPGSNRTVNANDEVLTKWDGTIENPKEYPNNTYGKKSIISNNRKHVLIYDWVSPYVLVDGAKIGTAPAFTAEWNDKTKSFFWNALEGQELVVYEYKP